jgi:hypothetical protein
MFSGPWPIFYAQASRFFTSFPHLLDYGTSVGGALGIAACMYGSGALAERSPDLAMLLGPAAVWVYAVVYAFSPMSKPQIRTPS